MRTIARKPSLSILIGLFSFSFSISCARNQPLTTEVSLLSEGSRRNILSIYFIDVGQADSILIISPKDKKLLVDGGDEGNGSAHILPLLRNLGVSSLDYTVASHYHSDHIGGLDEVIAGIGGSTHIISAAYDRGGSYGTGAFKNYATSVGNKRRDINPGQIINLGGGVCIECIASNGFSKSGRISSNPGEHPKSVVLLLRYKSFELFLGGDANEMIEKPLAEIAGDIDVYKVSHHGSATSSTDDFHCLTKPEVSIISVGDGNTYGHPTKEALFRLAAAHSYVYMTEKGILTTIPTQVEVSNATIVIQTNGMSYKISGGSITERIWPTDSNGETLLNRPGKSGERPFAIFAPLAPLTARAWCE